MPRKCTGHSKHPLPNTQDKTLHKDITRWLVNTEIRLIIFFAAKDGETLYSQQKKTSLGANCGSDDELLTAKFRLKLKKVGKTTGSFMYNLNQIPYNYTVEVTDRFKGLDLIECLKIYGQGFVTSYRRQRSRPSPRKEKCKKAKWLSKEALQIAEKRKEAKGKGEKERYTCCC